MGASILTSFTEQEFKELLKQAVREVLIENIQLGDISTTDILNIEEAACFLKLKVTTLYEKTSKKQIPHFKKGNTLYFDKNELTEWIKAGKVKTKSEIEGEATTFLLKSKKKSVL